MLVSTRSRFHPAPDLAALIELYESNYVRLMRLAPELESMEGTVVSRVAGALDLYLEIEKVRFGERLIIEKSIDAQARTALVPSLILQPLIENAIKYAISPSEEGGTLKISARVQRGRKRQPLGGVM